MSLYLQDIISSGANIQITIGANDLMQCFRSAIQEAKNELESGILAKKQESYVKPKEASGQLQVDLSTLWRWAKAGYLVPIEVGGKRLYKQSDIDAILNK